MAPRQVPFNHGCSPHIRTEPHGIQLLQEMPPWNLLRSKRPGRWRRDAKHLAEKPTGSIVGHEVPSPVKTTTSWDFDGFPTGSIRDEHFQWNEYRLNQIFGGGGPSNSWSFLVQDFFWGITGSLIPAIFCAKCPTSFYVHNQKTPSVFWRLLNASSSDSFFWIGRFRLTPTKPGHGGNGQIVSKSKSIKIAFPCVKHHHPVFQRNKTERS